MDRAHYLANKDPSRSRWVSQTLADPMVVVIGDAAVLRALVTDLVRGPEGPVKFRMPMTQVWVRGDPGWRCLAGRAGPRMTAES